MILMGITVAGAVVVFSVSIAGLMYSKKMVAKFDNVKCSVYLFINELIQGPSELYTPDYDWKGIGEAKMMGMNALATFDSSTNELKDLAEITIESEFPSTDAFLFTLDDEIGIFDAPVTDPTIAATGALTLDMFSKSEGRYEITLDLKVEVEALKSDVYNNLKGLRDGAVEFKENDDLIIDAKRALDSIDRIEFEINSFRLNLYNYVDKARTGFKGFQIGMIVFYAVMILSSVLIAGGSVVSAFRGSKCWGCLGNIGCVLLGILMTLGFLIVAILYPLSAALIEACDELKQKTLYVEWIIA
jgi:hypothetical protein